MSVAWKDGDKFTVFRNGNSTTFTKATGTNDFTGTLPDKDGSGMYYAIYPTETGKQTATSYVNLTSQGSGSLNPNLTYMYATSEDGQTFEFRHLTALLKPTFTGILAGESVRSVAVVCDAPTKKYQDLTNNTVKTPYDYSISFTALPAYIYLPPMTTGQKLVLTVTTDQNTYAATLTAKKDIVAGKLYTTTIALEPSALTTEWTPDIVAVQPVGEGTEDSPYLIANAPNLQWLKDNDYLSEGKYYQLTADLTINGAWEPIALYNTSPFKGTFEGNNQTISGAISYNKTIEYYPCGLFGYNEGTIRNLNVKVNINDNRRSYSSGSTRYIGAVAAYNKEGGVIANCTNEGTVTGTVVDAMTTAYVGGIVGYNEGTITGCTNQGDVTGVPQNTSKSNTYSYAGGIVGYHISGLVSECVNKGDVQGNVVNLATGNSVVGGIAGEIGSAVIIGCTNSGAVTGVQSSASENHAGGIVGTDANTGLSFVIAGCINSGAVTGGKTSNNTHYSRTGGVIGYSRGSATTTFCIACANTGTLTEGTGNGNIYVAAIGAGEFTRTALWAAGNTYASGDSYTLVKGTSAEQTSKDAISAMNAAIATYNNTAADGKKCPYTWQWESDDWPILVKNNVPAGATASVTLPGETEAKEYVSGSYQIVR